MMELDIREEEGKLVIAADERNHTLMNFLKRAVWDAEGRAGYNTGHPFEGDAGELVVDGDDPEEVLKDAIQEARERLDEFEDAFGS